MLLVLLTLFTPLGQGRAGTAPGPDWRARVAAACHIAPERLALRREEGDDVDVLRIEGFDPLPDAKLRCYARQLTAEGAPNPGFEDDQLSTRYFEIAEADAAADDRRERRNARAYLLQRGLLHRLPRFDRRHERLGAFAVRLEQLCRAAPHSALFATHDNIQVTRAVFRRNVAHFDRIDCAVHAAIASGYQVFGVRVSMPRPVPAILPVPQVEAHIALPAVKPM